MILVCALCLFVCGEGEEVRSVPVLQLKIGDRPCLNLVLGLKRGQTLFKLGAWIEKGDRPCLNLTLGLKRGTDLHLNPITAFAKKMCESKKVKKKCVYFLLKEVYNCCVVINFE